MSGQNSWAELRQAIEKLPPETREWEKVSLLLASDDYLEFIKLATWASAPNILAAGRDYADDAKFRLHFGPRLTELEGLRDAGDLRFHSVTLYLLVRLLQPNLLVETGVAHGKSSSAILLGLDHNGAGHLLSVDVVPDGVSQDGSTTSMSGRDTGWLVPEYLRHRWTLEIQDSVGFLRGWGGGDSVDIFFHDSLHTFDHLSAELVEVENLMSSSGLIIADNLEMESGRALEIFASRTGATVCSFGNLGFLRVEP